MAEKIKWITVSFGTVATYLIGGFDDILFFLVIAMCLDYISGVVKAWYLQDVSSRIGYKGIVKKVMIFFILIVAVQLDRTTGVGTPIFRTMVCWFFIANEGISILENCGAMGLPIPEKLKQALTQIKSNEGIEKNEQM